MKKFIVILLVVILLGLGAYFIIYRPSPATDITADTNQPQNNEQIETPAVKKDSEVIGKSVDGRDITVYHYGVGDNQILFVAGIHGGYEWNTVLLAYEAMDYFKANLAAIPENVKVSFIPVLNPDGLYKVVGTSAAKFTQKDISTSQATQVSGRYNANNVDLNRNFDCDWQSSAKWQSTTVSGGSSAFSEPESIAVKNYIETQKPKAVVVWFSAAGGVFASNCNNGILPETKTIRKAFADASKYPAYDSFDFYPTTGDMANWLAKENIPAISVLLTNHIDTEWTKNQAGIDALLKYFAK